MLTGEKWMLFEKWKRCLLMYACILHLCVCVYNMSEVWQGGMSSVCGEREREGEVGPEPYADCQNEGLRKRQIEFNKNKRNCYF